MSIALEEYKETTFAPRKTFPATKAVLRITDATLEESQDQQSFVVKWGFEIAQIADPELVGVTFSPWNYLPKNGLSKKGKPHALLTRLTTMARKLNISLAGISSDSLTPEFIAKFKGRAFGVGDLAGEERTQMKNGEPVMEEDGTTPKKLVDYVFWQIGEAKPDLDVDTP